MVLYFNNTQTSLAFVECATWNISQDVQFEQIIIACECNIAEKPGVHVHVALCTLIPVLIKVPGVTIANTHLKS